MAVASSTVYTVVSELPHSTVECGECFACCTLLSPNLTPEEVESGKYPLSLTKGETGFLVSIFRTETGGCSLLIDGKCSVYNDRPQACRQYDCRKGHHQSTNHIAKEKFGIDI